MLWGWDSAPWFHRPFWGLLMLTDVQEALSTGWEGRSLSGWELLYVSPSYPHEHQFYGIVSMPHNSWGSCSFSQLSHTDLMWLCTATHWVFDVGAQLDSFQTTALMRLSQAVSCNWGKNKSSFILRPCKQKRALSLNYGQCWSVKWPRLAPGNCL